MSSWRKYDESGRRLSKEVVVSDEDKTPPDDTLTRALIASSRAERPAEGARTRAFAAVTDELRQPAPELPTPRQRLRRAFAWASPVLVAALFGGGLLVKHQRDDARRAAVEIEGLEAEMRQAESDRQKLTAELRTQTEEATNLKKVMENTKDPVARAAIADQVRLADAKVVAAERNLSRAISSDHGHPVVHAAGSAGTPARATAACKCTAGDPLCSCL
jgi:hypothetical protein